MDERRYEWEAYDDLSGEALDPEKVMAARKLEMEYFKKHNVFTKVPQEECWRVTGGPPIKSRWIDVDKGEIYRSRWVAKQFRGKDMEEWFGWEEELAEPFTGKELEELEDNLYRGSGS